MNEAFKKQMLSSHEFYKARRWEKKPWSYKMKYAFAVYPEFSLTAIAFVTIIPLICWCKHITYPNSRKEAMKKYKNTYTVVRDDDPDIEEIKREKELGREFFPKY